MIVLSYIKLYGFKPPWSPYDDTCVGDERDSYLDGFFGSSTIGAMLPGLESCPDHQSNIHDQDDDDLCHYICIYY